MIKFHFNICWTTCIPGKRLSTHVVQLKNTCNIAYLRTNYKMSIEVRLCFVYKDGASWLNSVLFWILKAVYGILATPDSICYHNYSYYDIRNQKQAKESSRNSCESEEIFEGE